MRHKYDVWSSALLTFYGERRGCHFWQAGEQAGRQAGGRGTSFLDTQK